MTSSEWRGRIDGFNAELTAIDAECTELKRSRPNLALEEDGAGLKKLDARVSALEHQARNLKDSIEAARARLAEAEQREAEAAAEIRRQEREAAIGVLLEADTRVDEIFSRLAEALRDRDAALSGLSRFGADHAKRLMVRRARHIAGAALAAGVPENSWESAARPRAQDRLPLRQVDECLLSGAPVEVETEAA